MINGRYRGKYIGKTMCGFVTGFEYEIEISNNGRTYQISANKDITLDQDIDICIAYASENSIKRSWEIEIQ